VYAVVESGGKQYRVQPGDVLEVDRLHLPVGEEVSLGRVLLLCGQDGIRVGTPTVPGAAVRAQVLGHYRKRKVIVFKYKPKERYRRKSSQRRSLTRLLIKEITA
jgi:large subunit ribosomal protein L21